MLGLERCIEPISKHMQYRWNGWTSAWRWIERRKKRSAWCCMRRASNWTHREFHQGETRSAIVAACTANDEQNTGACTRIDTRAETCELLRGWARSSIAEKVHAAQRWELIVWRETIERTNRAFFQHLSELIDASRGELDNYEAIEKKL